MGSCTVSGLWNQVRGNPPFLSEQEFMAENINLLCQLLTGGGGSGGGGGGPSGAWIYWEDAHLDDNPPPFPTKAAERRFRNGDSPLTWDPTVAKWF